ncbi:DNA-binding response regulator [Actinomadura sp. NTSP31]|uniref:response regulator transcription factor n=1 Tax=Actinomadura sp. NTSP31 TaxID=1735447 RepID=UPI0035BF2532
MRFFDGVPGLCAVTAVDGSPANGVPCDLTVVVVDGPVTPGDLIGREVEANPVLVFGSSADHAMIEECFTSGASGYVHCSVPLHTLVAAVYAVTSRVGRFLSIGDVPGLLSEAEESDEGADSLILSARESEVLSHIAAGRTHGQVARILGISRHTVDTYVKRIRKKLGPGNKADLTRAAMERKSLMSPSGTV